MKKLNVKVMALLLMGSMAFHSCVVGSYCLMNKYCDWQMNMTGNKFVNGVVGIILGSFAVPITSFVDALVLNTIEFWTGDNPMASNAGKTQKVLGTDGRYYAVKMLKNGYELTAPTGEVSYFLHDASTDTWSLQQNGKTIELFRFNGDGTITTLALDGQNITVKPNEAGLYQVRMAATNGQFFAMR
jgi:hypothetical protein